MTLDPPQPELLAEYQLVVYFTSAIATHVRPVADLAEAETIGGRLGEHVAWGVRSRYVTPWRPVGPVVRNCMAQVPVDQDDVMDLHPAAVPRHRVHNPPRPRAGDTDTHDAEPTPDTPRADTDQGAEFTP